VRDLVPTPEFKRACRKFVRRDRSLEGRIEETLRQMHADLYAPSLGAHKLSGKLSGLWACSCGYDRRIVFSLETDPETRKEVVLLLDIGTHDEVY
jgi:mRNA-degrading endonuclease YafQ of YafQ-DinJ toxin-antitoxin module